MEAKWECVAQQGWRVYADPAGHPFCLVRDWWNSTGGPEPVE